MIKSPYATSFTKTGKPDYTNRKPYRNADQKRMAKSKQYTHVVDGRHVSTAPVSFHS